MKELPGMLQLYSRELDGGALAVGVLNRGAEKASGVSVKWVDIGVPAGKSVKAVKDLWANKDVIPTSDGLTVDVESHDTTLLRLDLT